MNAHATPALVGFIQGVGTTELLIIFFVILLLFGAKKLPELARGMGKSIREFKKATNEIEEDIRSAMDPEEEPLKPEKAIPVGEAEQKSKAASPPTGDN
jgi:sec-independent protein translocase protein TatA